MILMTLDVAKSDDRFIDLAELRGLVERLVGEPLLRVNVAYGDELYLHLGKPRPCGHPLLPNAIWGDYLVNTRASRWQLKTSPTHIFWGNSDLSGQAISSREFEALAVVAPETRVASVDVFPFGPNRSIGLEIKFSDGSRFRALPELDPSPDHDMANWEVSMPNDRALIVGPGPRWAEVDEGKANDHGV